MAKADKIALWLCIAIVAFVWAVMGFHEIQKADAQAIGDHCLARWVWNTDDPASPYWEPPFRADSTGGLDMRPLAQQAQQGGSGGWGWFAYAKGMGGSGMDCYGADLDAALRDSQADTIALVLGQPAGSIQARTLRGVIEELLTTDSDPTGLTGPKPLIPTSTLRARIHLGQTIVDRRFQPGSGVHWDKILQVHQADYQRLRAADLLAGQDTYRKFHQTLIDRYHINQSAGDIFIPPALRGLPDTTPLTPTTTINESFNTADSDTLGPDLSWTEVATDLDIVSNKAQVQIGAGVWAEARAESDLSTEDHYAQADVTWVDAGSSFGTVEVRFDPSSNTHYKGGAQALQDVRRIQKVESGTRTNLNEDAHTIGAETLAVKLEVDGSDLTLTVDGLTTTSTDTAITGHVRAGIGGFSLASGTVEEQELDNFEAADLSAGSAPAFASFWFFSVSQSWLRWLQ